MELSVLLERFITAKVAKGLTRKSVAWYEEEIGKFIRYACLNEINQEHALAPEMIEAFLAHERRRGLADSTIDCRYRSLSAWCGWLAWRKYIGDNPMLQVERPIVPKVPVEHVELSVFQHLHRSIPQDAWIDLRDRLMLNLMFWSGLRVAEVIGLAIDDIYPAKRIVHVRKGKGRKSRNVPCPEETVESYLAYLDKKPEAARHEDALILSDDGAGSVRGVLSTNGVRQMLERRCALADVEYINPHKLRHSYAVFLLNGGMPIKALSDTMGHRSVQTTEKVYAFYLADPLQVEYDEALTRARRRTKKT